MDFKEILTLAREGKDLNKEQALELLNISNSSEEFYELISTANYLSRKEYKNKGLIFAQIGINAAPCSMRCKFCSMGQGHYALEDTWKKDIDTIKFEVNGLLKEGINDLFLMTTADYPVDKFIEIGKQVKKQLGNDIRFVSNIGDIDNETAIKLKEAGFTGAYHIVRLNEGVDTDILPEVRIQTLDAIKNAGLELYYCIEPIGPEHNYEQLVDEMLRAKSYNVTAMAAMRRIPVPGTPLFEKGQVSAIELTKITAVTRLVVKPTRSMNAHEPTQMTLLAGVNQLYAESGANPRDVESNTEKNRGFTVSKAWAMLKEAEYEN